MSLWNPRFVLYAEENGHTPDQQLEWDRTLWPGGMMCGFTLWIGKQIAEAKSVHPEWFMNSSLYNHPAFDEWLVERAKERKCSTT
jgi:hypothetical protein